MIYLNWEVGKHSTLKYVSGNHNFQCHRIRRGFCLLASIKLFVYLHGSSTIIFSFQLKISKIILDINFPQNSAKVTQRWTQSLQMFLSATASCLLLQELSFRRGGTAWIFQPQELVITRCTAKIPVCLRMLLQQMRDLHYDMHTSAWPQVR